MALLESPDIISFNQWLEENGGSFHPYVHFNEVPSGMCVTSSGSIPSDTKIVTCPFTLAITEEVAQKSLLNFMKLDDIIAAKSWTERQWITTYICFHEIIGKSSYLGHHAYLKTLPSPSKLRTSLHFTQVELNMFKGTNLYGATLDRESEWRAEWEQCHSIIDGTNPDWARKFSWDLYLIAATYLSSRAFPSTVLSRTPSLQSSPSTKPVLLPGIDSLNHARGQAVSWVVSYPDNGSAETSEETPNISLVIHTPAVSGQELLNNYGAKPNAELILGYGFSLPKNPDDTIVLKIGGMDGGKWEVGRSAKGVDGLWDEIVRSMIQDAESSPTYEDCLDAAGALEDMVQTLLDRLPDYNEHANIRPEVFSMLQDYVEGQTDILESIIAFAQKQAQLAITAARAEGIEIILEDE